MQAVILAAGMGKRLKQLTKSNTKCMVEVNGITLIERMLRILDKKCLSRIVVVVGYEGQKLMHFIDSLQINTPIRFIDNQVYDKTNNIYSLALAKDYLISEDTLILESDLIFEEAVIDVLLQDKRETLALADKFESWMDGLVLYWMMTTAFVTLFPESILISARKRNIIKLLIYINSVNTFQAAHMSLFCRLTRPQWAITNTTSLSLN